MKPIFAEFGEFTQSALNIMNYISLILDVVLLVFFSWFYLIYIFIAFKRTERIKIRKPKNKFAVLIAARDESKVIKNILNSLRKQDYPRRLFDVYIIVENIEDKTVEILKKYPRNFFYVVRENLEGRRTKGYALDDAIKHIKNNKKSYDAYLIFDADNIADKNYISVMNSIKEEGYQIGLGYRNFTNATKNWISLTSGILFSFLNVCSCTGRSYLFKKASLTGTGYFIDSTIVDDAGGWIWNGMTEDVELTYYAFKNGIKMKYYPLVSYYDEQATKFKTLHHQHVRWVWGYLSKYKKKYKNYDFNYDKNESKIRKIFRKIEQKLGIYPFLIFIIFELIIWILQWIFGFINLGLGESNLIIKNCFIFGSYHLFIAYMSFVIIALLTIALDNQNLKFSFKKCVIAVITYPIFFLDFLFAFLDGLFNKNKRTKWKVIEHNGEIIDKDALNKESR